MKSLIKRITLTLASAGMLLFPILVPATAMAAIDTGPIYCGVEGKVGDDCPPDPETDDELNRVIKLAINIFSWIVGVAAVIMVMVGGMMYVTSGGSSEKVGKAKDTILYAIIGLVVVALAQVIVRFVVSKL